MRELLGISAAVILSLLAPALLIEYFYRRGFEKGVELGRKDADNWWINAEQEVDQARVKIWREGN